MISIIDHQPLTTARWCLSLITSSWLPLATSSWPPTPDLSELTTNHWPQQDDVYHWPPTTDLLPADDRPLTTASWPLRLTTEDGCWEWLLRMAAETGCWARLLTMAAENGCWEGLLRMAAAKGCWEWLLRKVADNGCWEKLLHENGCWEWLLRMAAEKGCSSFKISSFLVRGGSGGTTGETTFSSFRGRRTPETVVRCKFLTYSRATFPSFRDGWMLETVVKCKFFTIAAQPLRHFVIVGRPKLWWNANFSRSSRATFPWLRDRRMSETVLKWCFLYDREWSRRFGSGSYIFVYAAVVKRRFVDWKVRAAVAPCTFSFSGMNPLVVSCALAARNCGKM